MVLADNYYNNYVPDNLYRLELWVEAFLCYLHLQQVANAEAVSAGHTQTVTARLSMDSAGRPWSQPQTIRCSPQPAAVGAAALLTQRN